MISDFSYNYSCFSALMNQRKTNIPILAITKENKPKVAVKSDTFKPPANIDGLGFPMASTESKAEIKPITDPRNPKTNPNKLESIVSFSNFFVFAMSFLRLMKPLINRKMDSRRQIKISDIKNGPPSLNRSTNGFEMIITFDITNSFIINDIKFNIIQT